jgi:hypothetical protein
MADWSSLRERHVQPCGRVQPMDGSSLEQSVKADLHRYLQDGRDAVVWKLEGLSEYDKRRPLVSSGTNLLGLMKHLAAVEIGYFGDTFGRPFSGWTPRLSTEEEPEADMWVRADEDSERIVEFYKDVWRHSDSTIADLPLDTIGRVPWWPEDRSAATLGHLLVRVAVETNRHAGHADIVRELIDGVLGLTPRAPNIPEAEDEWWVGYRDRLEAEASRFRQS